MVKIPVWLRPKEVDSFKYWFHLLIIAFIVLLLLELFFTKGMLTIKNVIISTALIGLGDVISHSLLGLD